MKLSQVFAAKKLDMQASYNAIIREELVPTFNAEIEDIEREVNEIYKSNQARAKIKRAARVAILNMKRWDILNPLKIEFKLELDEFIKELGGEVKDNMVHFKDESTATPCKGLFIDFTPFHFLNTPFDKKKEEVKKAA